MKSAIKDDIISEVEAIRKIQNCISYKHLLKTKLNKNEEVPSQEC